MTVYLVQSQATGSNIKIGTTRNVKQRISQLGLPNVEVLAEIPGGREVERQLHRRFSHLRISKDSEWFHPGPELLDFIHSESKPYRISDSVGEGLKKAARALDYISFCLLLVGWGPWGKICVGSIVLVVICSVLWAVWESVMNEPEEAVAEVVKTLEEQVVERRGGLTVLRALDDKETGGMGPVLLLGRASDTARLVKTLDRYGNPKSFTYKYFPIAMLLVNEDRYVDLKTGGQFTDEDREYKEQIQRALKSTQSWPVGSLGNEEESQHGPWPKPCCGWHRDLW